MKIDYTSMLAYLGTRCTACIVHMMYHSRYVYAAHIPVHVQTSTLCYNAAQNVLYDVSCWPSVKALNLWIRPKNMSPSFPIKRLFPELKTVGSNQKCFLWEYIFIYIFFVCLFFFADLHLRHLGGTGFKNIYLSMVQDLPIASQVKCFLKILFLPFSFWSTERAWR